MDCIGAVTVRGLLPQQAEHRPGLGERLAAGIRDDLERTLGRGDVGADDVPPHAGLHGDQRHAVRDDVVQLPGDPQPLLDDGAGRLLAGSRSLLLAALRRSDCSARRDRMTSPSAHAASSRAHAWSRSDVPRSGTSRSASRRTPGSTTPGRGRRPGDAVCGQRVQGEQQEHREQADVVLGEGDDQAPRHEDDEGGHRACPAPGQGQSGHQGRHHRKHIGSRAVGRWRRRRWSAGTRPRKPPRRPRWRGRGRARPAGTSLPRHRVRGRLGRPASHSRRLRPGIPMRRRREGSRLPRDPGGQRRIWRCAVTCDGAGRTPRRT